MVLMPEPLFAAVDAVEPVRPLFLLGPGGARFDQAQARDLATTDGFSLLCGRYEGVDERVRAHLVDGELSVGDFVLSGGEVAALVVIEAVARLVPGVMGNEESASDESFADGLLEYPQYTRPGRVPRLERAGRAAVGRPREDRQVASGAGAGPHDRGPARSHRGHGAACPRRTSAPWRSSGSPAIVASPLPASVSRSRARHEVH